MGRQTVRQQTRANVRHRSGTSNPRQTRAGRSNSPLSQPHPRRSRPPGLTSLLKQSHHPGFLLVFGLWAILLVAATLAARSLLDPTVVSPATVSSAPAVPSTAEAPPESGISPSPPAEPIPGRSTNGAIDFEQTGLPGAALDDRDFYQPSQAPSLLIVLLGATALSMAISGVLVSHALRPHRPIPRLESKSGRPPVVKSAALKQLAAATSPEVQPAPIAQPALVQTMAQTTVQTTSNPKTAEATTPAIVTVLPSDQSSPLDWDEPSLADSLDLRQQQSLPS